VLDAHVLAEQRMEAPFATSPAAKMSGSEARSAASVTIPLSTLRLTAGASDVRVIPT
jgi:hypothetical protein